MAKNNVRMDVFAINGTHFNLCRGGSWWLVADADLPINAMIRTHISIQISVLCEIYVKKDHSSRFLSWSGTTKKF
jgi:hypothetical protein